MATSSTPLQDNNAALRSIIVLLVLIIIIGGLASYYLIRRKSQSSGADTNTTQAAPTPTTSTTTTPTPTSTTTNTGATAGNPTTAPTSTPTLAPTATPTPTAVTNGTFENAYMKVTIPANWTATPALNGTALNIIGGKYILYVNSQAYQASGVQGGRLSEITQGAPSADAVEKARPQNDCTPTEKFAAYSDKYRYDLYVGPASNKEVCNIPANNATLWYFSYVTNGGPFNYYSASSNKGYVITMSYNEKDINKLPAKGSTELTNALNQMTDILKSLTLKQP